MVHCHMLAPVSLIVHDIVTLPKSPAFGAGKRLCKHLFRIHMDHGRMSRQPSTCGKGFRFFAQETRVQLCVERGKVR